MEQKRELFLIRPKDLSLFSGLLVSEAAMLVGTPNVMTVGVTNGELACGAISVAYDTEVGDILSLYVAQSERRRGAGRALIEGIAASAKRIGARQLQITCESAVIPAMGDFLSAVRFQCIQRIPRFRITLEQIQGMRLPAALPQNIYSLKQLPNKLLKEYNQLADERPNQLLRLEPNECDTTLSAFCLTPDKHLGGFVALAHRQGIEIANAYVAEECIKQMPALFRYCMANASAAYPPDTTVLIDAVTPSSEQLVRHLLQGLDAKESCVETFVRLL